jgi:hypothetical protein
VQAGTQRIHVCKLLAGETALQVFNDACCRFDTNIRHNKLCLKLVENVFVDLPTGREVREIVGQPAVAAIEARTQLLHESLARLLILLFRKHRYLLSPVGSLVGG